MALNAMVAVPHENADMGFKLPEKDLIRFIEIIIFNYICHLFLSVAPLFITHIFK